MARRRPKVKGCGACAGSGRYWYSSTSTFWGGMGGQSFTEDTCDRCWGSGDKEKPGENLIEKARRVRIAFEHRYSTEAGFRWKERARRFWRRYRNTLSNYRELQREITRLHARIKELETRG